MQEEMKALEKKKIAIHTSPLMLISVDSYKLGQDEVLHRCVLEHEFTDIIVEVHGGIVGDATTWKILLTRLWWETLYKDCKEYCKACDQC